MVASEGLYYSLHIYMFYNNNQPQQDTHIFHRFFSPSLLEQAKQAALLTFNGAISPTSSFCSFLLHILGMHFRASRSFTYSYILRIQSFHSRLKAKDWVLFRARSVARHWSYVPERAFFSSPFRSFSFRASWSFTTQKNCWQRVSIPRSSEKMSYILPQDHGVLAKK